MNPNLKAQWLKALRSGEYRQGEFRLRDGGQYCCLGVLCDIIDPDGWEGDIFHDRHNRESSSNVVPVSMALDLFGLEGLAATTNQNGELSFRDRTGSNVNLADMNDSGMPFHQIADVIEWAF